MVKQKSGNTLLVSSIKRLIAMNGRSQSPTDSQTSSPNLSRREKRKMDRRNGHGREENGFHTAGTIPGDITFRFRKLLDFLETYDNDFDKIEKEYGHIMEKDEKIKNLSIAFEELKHSNNEEIQELSQQIEEKSQRIVELEQQVHRMRNLQGRLQAQEEQEQERRNQLDNLRDMLDKLKTEKKKIMEENAKKCEAAKNKYSALESRAKNKISDLESKVNALREEKDQDKITLGLHAKNAVELELKLRESEQRYPIQTLPLKHYEDGFSKLRENLRSITKNYLSDLPPDNELDINEIQTEFSKEQSLFGTISLSASEVSKFLRVCAAQHIIIESTCKCFWQRFYVPGASLTPEAVVQLSQISDNLFEEDRHKESLWRSLTFRGLDKSTSSEDNGQVSLEVKKISESLRRLIPKEKHKDFEAELKSLFLESIKIWDELKRDSCVAEFDLNPPLVCTRGWEAKNCPELEPANEEANSKRKVVSNLQSWCLFPKITFNPIEGRETIFSGTAIFADSPAFQENRAEIQRQEEEFANFRKNFVRRLTNPNGTAH